ncbi:MAG: permease [Candidatus Omnitrophica bacterium]|nr:permease [Candidatus Omnitrophota bacterium]
MLKGSVDWFFYNLLGLDPEVKIVTTLNFFVYDSLKIILLLFVMISVIGFLRTYLPQHKIKKWLSRKQAFGNVFASLFGSITPFCSCSSIPIFLSFLKAGIPLGVTFSFLITSPLINEYLVVLMLGFFGWKITSLYILSGIIIGVASGLILGMMKLEKYLEKDLITQKTGSAVMQLEYNFKIRVSLAIIEAKTIVKKLWLWIILGVGAGAFIHNYIPQEAIQSIIDRAGIFSVPMAVILGVPMYGSCAAIVPIAVALFRKGVPLGTALSFMMAIAALSLPEAMILKRAMKLRILILFFGITTLGIIFTGYLFNLLQVVVIP